MPKKKIYLTADALREFADLVDIHNAHSRNATVAYIDRVKLDLMDEGAYSLQFQKGLNVHLEYRPEFDDIDNFKPSDTDMYVIVLS